MKIEEVWSEWSVEGASIGEGSYGEVYKCVCREDGNEKYSAIKVISVPKNDSDYSYLTSEEKAIKKAEYKEDVDNYLNEIKMLEALKGNKNIVEIEDSKVVEKEDGVGWQIFIRMELLTDLDKYIKYTEFDKEDVLKLGIDLCQALSACGKKRIVHRDIKPKNIFVDGEGNFKLGDFGVAKQLEGTMGLASKKGTPYYMSPEVFNLQEYDSRADIYSLALVLYTLLNNNRIPFLTPEKQMITSSEKEKAFNRRIKGEKIPPLKDIDENINVTLLRALEYKKEDRFKNAEEFETALRRCAQGKRTKKSFKQIAENSVITKAVSIILVAAIVSTVLAVFLNRRPQKKELETIIVSESTTAETTATTSATKKSTTKETTTEDSTTKKTTEKTTKKETWKTAYREYLTKLKEKESPEENLCHYFCLKFVDGDNIPELLVNDNTYHNSQVEIFTYADSKIKSLGKYGSWGEIGLAENEGLLTSCYEAWGGFYQLTKFSFKNNKINEVWFCSKDCLNPDNSTFADDYTNFYINDKKVSSEEFEESYSSEITYCGIQSVTPNFKLTEENIKKVIG